jgi:hypothetical protein
LPCLAILTGFPRIRAVRAAGRACTPRNPTRGSRSSPIRPASRWLGATVLGLLLGAAWGAVGCDTASAASEAHVRDRFRSGASIPGLSLTLSTNQSTFQAGDLLVLSAAASGTTAVTGDFYLVVQTPAGDVFSRLASGAFVRDVVPLLSSLSLPAGFTFPMQPIFSATLPTLPVGTYTWFGAFTEPGSLTLLSNLARVDWAYENPPPTPTYVVENRTLDSGGVTRTFVLSRPTGSTAGLPLVILLHGDGGDGAGNRAGFQAIESGLLAVYAYPDAPGPDRTFVYYTAAGRAVEAQFEQDLITALAGELAIDTTRVFVGGLSGGATMSNALGCYLGPDVIRGLGIASGTLYAADNDIQGAPDGGVFCPPGSLIEALPAALIVWGTADVSGGTTYDPDGLGTRDTHLRTQACAGTTTPGPHAPCVIYGGCTRAVHWCPIDGLGHALWPGAPAAFATFFDGLH